MTKKRWEGGGRGKGEREEEEMVCVHVFTSICISNRQIERIINKPYARTVY
jgi:hypothetical protein